MPEKMIEGREYRSMPVMTGGGTTKRFDSDQYVEGYATTFNEPYILFSCDGIDYKEVIDRHALDQADLSDVIFQYDHGGMVFARNKMAKGKKQTMTIEPQDKGLFVAADLSSTEDSKRMFESIDKGLIYQMSWCFVVKEDSYDRETHTRTITKISKVYDVSAVSIPANPSTDIASRSARSYFDGVIEMERKEHAKAESDARKKQITLTKLKLEGI